MRNFFIPYEIACKLRRKGFDEECFGRFVNGELLNYKDNNSDSYHWSCEIINAPSYQEVVDWFRNKGYAICVIEKYHNEPISYEYQILNLNIPLDDRKYHNKEFFYESSPFDYFKTYHEALNKAIEEALKLI